MATLSVTELIDKPLYAKGDVINIRRSPELDAPVLKQVPQGQSVGIVYSWVQRKDSAGKTWVWFQVEGIVKNGWVRQDVVSNVSVKPSTTGQTQPDGNNLIQDIIKKDYATYHNLLVSAEIIDRLKKKGKSVASNETTLNSLIKEYTDRQAKIKDSKLVNFQTRFNEGYEWLKNKWSAFISGVGAFPLIPVAIGAAVGIGTSAAIYLAFKPDYDGSVRNLKESNQLKSLLETIDPAIAAQIRANLEGQIDQAYNQGQTDGAFNILGMSLKNLALVALGAFAVIKGPELLNKKTKSKR